MFMRPARRPAGVLLMFEWRRRRIKEAAVLTPPITPATTSIVSPGSILSPPPTLSLSPPQSPFIPTPLYLLSLTSLLPGHVLVIVSVS